MSDLMTWQEIEETFDSEWVTRSMTAGRKSPVVRSFTTLQNGDKFNGSLTR